MVVKRDREMKEPVDLLKFYMLSKYGVIPSKQALPFREQIIKSTRVDKYNSVMTFFVNLPREYDEKHRPLCFETIVIKKGASECHIERTHELNIAEQTHLQLYNELQKTI